MCNQNLGENLIFLISQPRSGSTMLQLILSAHPKIHTTSEPWLMLHPIYALKNNGYSAEYNASLSRSTLTTFLNSFSDSKEDYYKAIRIMTLYLYNKSLQSAYKLYFLDKTPRYYLIIPELVKIFPEAKFIILIRNPLSVLASILNTWVKGNWVKLKNYYIDLFEAPNLLYEGIKTLSDKAFVVNYENFVESPETELKKIIEFLNLEFDPEIINYGQIKLPNWPHGDQIGIKKYKKPEKANIDKWLQLIKTSQSTYLGKKYLEILGPELINNLGYNYVEMENTFNKVQDFKLNISLSWDKIFAAEQTRWNKTYLRALGILDRMERVLK